VQEGQPKHSQEASDAPLPLEGPQELDQVDEGEFSLDSETAEASNAPLPLEEPQELDHVDEGEFPLDSETAEQGLGSDDDAQAETIQDLTASSGIIDPDAKSALKLPELSNEDFPLDHEQDVQAIEVKTNSSKSMNESETPVTISTGVFESNGPDPELKLPAPKGDDFPLDSEMPENSSQKVQSTAQSELTVSSGVVEDDTARLTLREPPKSKEIRPAASTT